MSNISGAISLFGSLTNLARAVGVSVQCVCFWRDGRRKIPPDKCVSIERVTGGMVTRRDLRPSDWWKIWPELVDEGSAGSRPLCGGGGGGDHSACGGSDADGGSGGGVVCGGDMSKGRIEQ